ncbi:hypothetical protein DSM101010T_12590 [Desulfovibrio subterraneus]|uniref:Uncharacterized protein n=1 Tax=Desulfovibrio subterraneus TaxID=2718620 RepID=A0A7J0BIH5_9BACT|nr:hypothetical protein DSM101010T_12590 [Desulfovibrio subterraneus]
MASGMVMENRSAPAPRGGCLRRPEQSGLVFMSCRAYSAGQQLLLILVEPSGAQPFKIAGTTQFGHKQPLWGR